MGEETKTESKLGGKRPGAGRKKTGVRRHALYLYVNDDEDAYVRACLEKYRKEHPDKPKEEKKSTSFYVTESEREKLQDFLNGIRKSED